MNDSKTVFIPSLHFPPSAMLPSQRVRLLIRHLHELGWKPVIFTDDHYHREEIADPWMTEIDENDISKGSFTSWLRWLYSGMLNKLAETLFENHVLILNAIARCKSQVQLFLQGSITDDNKSKFRRCYRN